MYTNGLLNLRTTYLRAIPMIWNSNIELGTENKGSITLAGAKNPIALQPGHILPAYTRDSTGHSSGFFYEFFQYVCPWEMTINLNLTPQKRPQWSPEATAGWYGGEDFIEIYIPKPPSSDLSEALAAWYHQNPSFLREPSSSGMPAFPESDFVVPNEVPQKILTELGNLMNMAIPTHLGDSSTDFLAFGSVILRAVALAWREHSFPEKDQNFIKQFITETDTITETGQTSGKAIQALEAFFGYKYPWNLDLVVRWDMADYKNGKWGKLEPTTVQLAVPTSPKESFLGVSTDDVMIEPIALTAYNDAGVVYPFTCN